MRARSFAVQAALLAAVSFHCIGCDKGVGRLGMTGTAGSEAGDQRDREINGIVGVGGTGNAATTTGAGASNGVSGTETPGAGPLYPDIIRPAPSHANL